MRVVGYVRLSRDEDRENYGSIIIQKKIIEEYAKENSWQVQTIYEDDNCSGYTFDRPALNHLIKDLENDQIDIVIAKDLSRIGRHNALTLLFIEQIKKLGKRLILPKESGMGYDTAKDMNDMLGITTWYNEMYIKDISRKIRSSVKTKQKEGKLLIRDCFGYKRSSRDKHALIIDEETAPIVRLIFKYYTEGFGYRKIAEMLNEKGCPTPSEVQRRQYEQNSQIYKGPVSSQWTMTHVQRILKNDIYIGTLRLAKTKKPFIKGKSVKTGEEEQFIFENHHEPIISPEDYERVQQILSKRNTIPYRGRGQNNNIFSGFLFCEDCGSYMIAYQRSGKPKQYICGTYHKYGTKACQRHSIREDVLVDYIGICLSALGEKKKPQIQALHETLHKEIHQRRKGDENGVSKIGALENALRQLQQEFKLLLSQKLRDMAREDSSVYRRIIEDSYAELEREKKNRINLLKEQIEEMRQEKSQNIENTIKSPTMVWEEIVSRAKTDRRDLTLLIDKITVDKKGNPTIRLNGGI